MQRRGRSWRGEQSGEYTLVRRWRWAAAAARVYEAFNRRTGAAAVVLKPGRVGDWSPAAAPWVARVSSTAEHLAVELEPHPRLRGAKHLEEVTLGLYRLANALAQVEAHPAAQAALAGDVAAVRMRRARWVASPRYVAALACAAVAALLAAPRTTATRTPPPHPASPVQLAEHREERVAMTPQVPDWMAAIGTPMPKKPYDGQVRAVNGKCAKRGETAINGGCWVKLDLKPPCGDDAYEWEGACYLASWPPMREPQSKR
jgi:hypothetical protein